MNGKRKVSAWIAVLLMMAILLSTSVSLAETDLSGLSFDELVALKDRINLAIWESKDWQEVQIPQGEWTVGEDIPEGKWTIKCADVNRSSFMLGECHIEWGFKDSKGSIRHFASEGGGNVTVYNPESKDYDAGNTTETTADLQAGMIIRIREAYAPAVFSPYAGKPDLGFKFGK